MAVLGMDVSRHQVLLDSSGNIIEGIDFGKAVIQGVKFVGIRASVGDYYTDPAFCHSFDAARAQGLVVLAYHVTRPDKAIKTQMDRFQASLSGRVPDLYVLDNEVEASQLPDRITMVIRGEVLEIMSRFGKRPLNYTRETWYDPHTNADCEISKCDLWPARYKDGLTSPWSDGDCVFRDWNTWKMWQYSADGNGLGAQYGVQSASVDLDWFNGTEAELMEYAGIPVQRKVRVMGDVVRIWDEALGATSGITWKDQVWNATGEQVINGETYIRVDGLVKKALVEET